MSGPSAVIVRRTAALMWALCVALSVPTVVLLVVGSDGLFPGRPGDIFSGIGGAAFLLLALTFASVGAVVARRVPENPIGWVFCITGVLSCVNVFTALLLLPWVTVSGVER